MLKQYLQKIGLYNGQPRSLSHKENSRLRRDGLMKSYEVAWESVCEKHLFIRDNKTSEFRVVTK
mgnify:CR=1 FL=1